MTWRNILDKLKKAVLTVSNQGPASESILGVKHLTLQHSADHWEELHAPVHTIFGWGQEGGLLSSKLSQADFLIMHDFLNTFAHVKQEVGEGSCLSAMVPRMQTALELWSRSSLTEVKKDTPESSSGSCRLKGHVLWKISFLVSSKSHQYNINVRYHLHATSSHQVVSHPLPALRMNNKKPIDWWWGYFDTHSDFEKKLPVAYANEKETRPKVTREWVHGLQLGEHWPLSSARASECQFHPSCMQMWGLYMFNDIPLQQLFNFEDESWVKMTEAFRMRSIDDEFEFYELVDIDAEGEDDEQIFDDMMSSTI
ncbi:hypothetical protein F4604DRAFT_1905751 [Suillus subluteus]|nr:hypothetical protein F4604DRAFT_1905751 [Suillus subluteus]